MVTVDPLFENPFPTALKLYEPAEADPDELDATKKDFPRSKSA